MFLTFEGIEGCGKSTQIARLAGHLRKRGIAVTLTREPGGSPIGKSLRALLLSESYSVAPETELLLYAAERAEHVARVIRPALASGKWVLCDRYGDATRAYQSWGRGLSRVAVEAAHAIAIAGLEPDLTIWLRLDACEAVSRARSRNRRLGSAEGRFEAEALAFHRRVAAGYEALAAEFPNRIVPVDGGGDVDVVFGRILGALEARHVLA
jgi:dTMP kinase